VPPQDGVLDFPTESFFDVFYEGWVDLNMDTNIDVGEVFRSEDAIRMYTASLQSTPPPIGQVFSSVGIVDKADPLRGTFGATVLSGPLILRITNSDGTLGAIAGQMDNPATGKDVHIVTPEPASIAAYGLCLLAGCGWSCRRMRLTCAV
jgi:hypothetical protein